MTALLVLHALFAMALVGSATHLVVVALRVWRGGHHLASRLRLHALVTFGLFGVAFLLGLLLYPHYRVQVRAAWLDAHAPWASSLFDIKENLAALALPLLLALWAVGRRLRMPEDGALAPLLAGLGVCVWLFVAVAFVSGLVVTNTRGV